MVDTDRFICKIEEIINSSKPGEDNSANCILNLCKLLEEFEVALENETGEECINAGRRLIKLSKSQTLLIKIPLFYSGVCVSRDPGMLDEYIQMLMDVSEELPADTLYYLWTQFRATVFRYPQLEVFDTTLWSWKLFKLIADRFSAEIGDGLLEPIPYEERTKGLVFVITSQFLSMNHGPTKTALDRCEVLKKYMNKNVLLINTCETLPMAGGILLGKVYKASFTEAWCSANGVEYEGENYPFFSCEYNMPNLEVLTMLIKLVRSKKPEYIVSIAGDDITSNLVSKIVPALTIGLAPSQLESTLTQCQTLSRPVNNEDRILLSEIGLPEWHILYSTFTSSLKKQNSKCSRSDYGFNEDDFVGAIVGARLNTDMTEEFLNMMLKASKNYGIKYLVLGGLEGNNQFFDHVYDKYPELKDTLVYAGFADDILANFEICDVYINPTRKGGGTSGVEALSKGLPVLSTPFGDVGTNVGEEFLTPDYNTMLELLGRYSTDKEFYNEMSQKALERADKMLNSGKEFSKTLLEFEQIIMNKNI